MVSATLIDTISSPTEALNTLYDEWRNGSKAVEFADVVSKHFSSLLSDERSLSQVPMLDARMFAPRTKQARRLVQFPAMVQDTSPSPELFLFCTRDGTHCNGWGLNEDVQLELESESSVDDYRNVKERSCLWAVDIPGIAPWQFVDQDAGDRASYPALISAPREGSKAHKSPLSDPASIVVQVKMYESSAENLRPTDLVNLVGILTYEEHVTEMNDTHNSDIIFPTLHVLFHQPMPKSITPRNYPMPNFLPSTRDTLIKWMANEALQGDYDVAEWILLGCISSVQSRNPPVLPLSITISQFKSDSRSSIPPMLAHVLKQIIPLSAYLPLSLNGLNTQKFIPESVDEDLHAGYLQLPKGTVLVMSDNDVEEGQLSDKGMRNLSAIQEVVKQQTLRYEFPFSQFSFETEIPVIMLTSGRKSVFCETDVIVPLKASVETAMLYGEASSIKLPDQPKLTAFRDLISSARQGKIIISDDMSKKIQADFVNQRRTESISSDDLIRRMTIARLMALSHHERDISDDIWSAAKALDERRIQRCKSMS